MLFIVFLYKKPVNWCLGNSNFYKGDLHGTDLRKAELRKTDLQNADLRGADLRGAYLQEAIFDYINIGINEKELPKHVHEARNDNIS